MATIKDVSRNIDLYLESYVPINYIHINIVKKIKEKYNMKLEDACDFETKLKIKK